jgi:predicted MFS family arabinose efflux permease
MDRRRWFVLAAVFVARTSMGYQFQSIGSVGPLLIAELAIDFAILGSLIGVYKLPGVILAFPSGLLGNRFGEKFMLIVGMGMMVLGGFIAALSDMFSIMFTARVISGAGAVLFNVLSAKMVADWFAEKELTLALAIYVNSWPFGIALGLATQATLAQTYSVNGMLSTSAMFCAVGIVLLAMGSRDRSPRDHHNASQFERRGITLREFVLVSLAALVWLLFNANLILVVSFSPAYLTAMGHDIAAAGRLTSVGTWLGIVSILLGGLMVQRGVSADRLMALTLLLGSAATFAIIWLDAPLLALIAFGILAWAPAGPIFALPVGVLKKANRAIGMGIFLSYYYLGIGLISPLAGYLRDRSGDPAAPIAFAAWLLAGALLMFILFRVFERIMTSSKREVRVPLVQTAGASTDISLPNGLSRPIARRWRRSP